MIPPELAERDQWLAWRYATRDGRSTKVPLSPHGGAGKSNDPATWGSYRAALATLEADGVGYVFAASDPYTGIDLDRCVGSNGAIHPAAHAIVDSLNGYVEFSPSGHGLHIIVRASLERGRHTLATEWHDELAIYASGRFFTMSGEGRGTIREAQSEVDALLARYFPDPEPMPREGAPVARPRPVCGDDEGLLRGMFGAANGERTRALWDGDLSGHAGDHSAADLALCGHLAFWTGNDPARMDSLFRRSGLMRDKWDEKRGDSTYGALTIRRAIGKPN